MITTKFKEYEIEKNKRRRNKNCIGQKKLRHLNYRLDIDYHRIYFMSGEGSTSAAYNPDIFSGTRIRIAPLLCLLGYLLNVFGILYRSLK